MSKKRRLISVVTIVSCVFFVFLINNQYENDIDKIINTALRIQYGWEKKDKLEDICTEEFITSTDWENLCFGKKIFWIEKGYMDNIKKISTTEIVIYVNVYTPDIRIHKFTLVKEWDGKYRINNIEHDI